MHTLVRDVDNGGDYACVGAESTWQISILFFQFCSEPKIALKNKAYFKKVSVCQESLWMVPMPMSEMETAFKVQDGDFPGGAVVRNPPANAGDTGSSPGPGRSPMARSNYTRSP